MVAAIKGFVDIARALLRHGANARHAGIGNLTPLHLASEKGYADLVEDLLRAGADPMARVATPPPRSTPLHIACRSTRLSSVEALLRGGADETMQDLTSARQPPAGPAVGGGAAGPQIDSPLLSPPSTTPYDVVGLGRFSPHQDPQQRDSAETEEEHARRRDPETIALIRRALMRAPADRRWRRRSWLIMLRAAATPTTARTVSSSMTKRLVTGDGLVGGGETGEEENEKEEEEVDEVAAGEGGVDAGDDHVDPNLTSKRVRRDDPAAETDESRTMQAAEAASGVEGSRETRTRNDDRNGGGVLSSGNGDGTAAGTEDVSSMLDGGGDTDDVRVLRRLCGRLFQLADVEEGAFRRVVCYL